MKTFNIQAAKTHLSRIVEEVLHGEEVILARAGKPLVKLVPFEATGQPRVGGQLAGQVWESDDCWDAADELGTAIDGPLYHQDEQGSGAARVAEGEAR